MLEFKIGDDSGPPTYEIPGLAPGEEYSVIRKEILPTQSYLNTATADSEGDVTESNENNNVATETCTVSTITSAPDLVISSLTHSPENPTTTDLTYIIIPIK